MPMNTVAAEGGTEIRHCQMVSLKVSASKDRSLSSGSDHSIPDDVHPPTLNSASPDPPPDPPDETKEQPKEDFGDTSPLFTPPLYRQRYTFTRDILKQHQVESVVDMGCSQPRLLEVLRHLDFRSLNGVDLLRNDLDEGRQWLRPMPGDFLDRRTKPLAIRLFCGSLTERDDRLVSCCEAITMIEVVEHLEPDVLAAFPATVFGFYRPRVVVMTTPNVEFNVVFKTRDRGFTGFRHWDHKFEWTRAEFRDWCHEVAADFEYDVEFHGIGEVPTCLEGEGDWGNIGKCSQAAVFLRRKEANLDIDWTVVDSRWMEDSNPPADSPYPLEIVSEFIFPVVEQRDLEQIKESELIYSVHRASISRCTDLEEQYWRIANNEQFENIEDAESNATFMARSDTWPITDVDLPLEQLLLDFSKVSSAFPNIASLVETTKRLSNSNPAWRFDENTLTLWVNTDDGNDLANYYNDNDDGSSVETPYDNEMLQVHCNIKQEEESWDSETSGPDEVPRAADAELPVTVAAQPQSIWQKLRENDWRVDCSEEETEVDQESDRWSPISKSPIPGDSDHFDPQLAVDRSDEENDTFTAEAGAAGGDDVMEVAVPEDWDIEIEEAAAKRREKASNHLENWLFNKPVKPPTPWLLWIPEQFADAENDDSKPLVLSLGHVHF